MIDLSSRQAGHLNDILSIIEEDKEIVTPRFAKRPMLGADEVITTPAALIISMRCSYPHLTGFDLYGTSSGRTDINYGVGVYREVQN